MILALYVIAIVGLGSSQIVYHVMASSLE